MDAHALPWASKNTYYNQTLCSYLQKNGMHSGVPAHPQAWGHHHSITEVSKQCV